jgi:hypothetical protein
MRWAGLLALAAVMASGPATAEVRQKGACYTVHARLTAGNGTPGWRLWPVGTTRLLGVLTEAGEAEFEPTILPGRLGHAFENPQTLKAAETGRLFADFTVCPLSERRPGVMQMVYIQSARNIAIRPK